jgi:hypothetical protein
MLPDVMSDTRLTRNPAPSAEYSLPTVSIQTELGKESCPLVATPLSPKYVLFEPMNVLMMVLT